MALNNNWFIDAWAVRDGAAFASRREPNSRDAENTVFIAVPDLEPIPVGRLTTALSATRRGFQAGLWSRDKVEVAFENLEQIIELVRRGFLAGGLGPGGAAAPVAGGRPQLPGTSAEGSAPDEGGTPGGAAHYEDAIGRTETHNSQWYKPSEPLNESLEFLATQTARSTQTPVASKMIGALFTLVGSFAEAITIDWEHRARHHPDPLDTSMLLEWYGALRELGVWSNGRGVMDFLKTHRCPLGEQLLAHAWALPWQASRAHEGGAFPRQYLISQAPCPRRPNWVSGLSRLADKVTLPMCIGNYFEENPHLPELAPSILGALLLTSTRFPSSGVTGSQFRPQRLAGALRWLAQETPRLKLPPDAEDLLYEYAWHSVQDSVVRTPFPA